MLMTLGKREEEKKRRRHLGEHNLKSFDQVMQENGLSPLKKKIVEIVQINVGLFCNLTCTHCHVESGPTRWETIGTATVDRIFEVIRNSPGVKQLDLTGGAPELNPQFRRIVVEARKLGLKLTDRCNLVVLYEKGQEDLLDFLAEHQVGISASLPCYTEDNVDKQRGDQTFVNSIRALQDMNKKGYGTDPNLPLDLVYNPGGAFLPGDQQKLEQDYKRELFQKYGIVFNNLFVVTNMPIKRFVDFLISQGQLESYMNTLIGAFNKTNCSSLMCTELINVGWDGSLYDCDFNQALEMGVSELKKKSSLQRPKFSPLTAPKTPVTLWDIDSFDELVGNDVATDLHCFGCTAGFAGKWTDDECK